MGGHHDEATTVTQSNPLVALPPGQTNPYVDAWQEAGGRVMGFTCSYVPEEVLFAGKGSDRVLPYRMGAQGCEQAEDAEIHLHKFCCGYAKCLLQLGLQGDYGFLDGVVWTNCCEQLRRSFEHWRDEVRPPFARMFAVPHVTEGAGRLAWMRTEVENLLAAVDEFVGRRTTTDDLRCAIALYNESRRLVRRLYELRALPQPKLTGTEAMQAVLAGFTMPRDLYNARLGEFLSEVERRPGLDGQGARIMVCGSYLDDTFLLELIEDTGAIVVTDGLCTGRRYVEDTVDEDGDPIDALARRYLQRASCPRMVGSYPQRVELTRRLAREAGVDGIVFQRLPFCDNHSVENLMEARDLQADGFATLHLEREYLPADRGRLKTRLQAFMEKLQR